MNIEEIEGPITGSCRCGGVQYEASGPIDFPHVCSCPDCQALAGGPMMSWIDLPREGFRWTKAEPKWFNTFPDAQRGFCAECGSSVAAQDHANADPVGVTLASLSPHIRPFVVPIHQSFKNNSVSWLPTVPVDNEA